ncbi:MBOAT, membrane-bound O-acyltransferase family-domain-containing protein [Phakopsora pachyrhizi]|uniref:MBOAT, membrane-bound O-acyltransferase family-domain-containing protein n=1 Tax=Phakopsora pachyrhizi TaxID=170000 RepID=A0AAV0BBW5_PHAPC|nr:MBOAT, membrane-bound O-acyltransferase family-domain-containing protein [Phakopsora pachyrhizi]
MTYWILSHSLKSGKLTTRTPWSIFLALIVHLTFNHARRLFWNDDLDAIEISGVQMVLVIKLSTFAWNVYDGQRKDEELDEYQRSTGIKHLPSFFEFLGYCFFYPSFLVGPAIPFREYQSFLNLKHNPSLAQVSPSAKNRIWNSLKKLFIGISFGAIVGVYGSSWSYKRISHGDLSNQRYLKKLLIVQASGFASRGKYYLAWSLAESAFTMLGFGYDYKAKDWKGGRNLEIFEIELAQSYKSVFDNWNIKTNIWLRECVYKRVAAQSKTKSGRPKPGFKTLMATFATSAAWHGPLPAYFLAFLSAGLLQALGRSIRSTIRPLFLNQSRAVKLFYDFCCLIITQTSLNYLVVPFVLLDIQLTKMVYSQLNWYGHIMAIIPMLVLWWPLGLEARLRKRHGSSKNMITETKNIII